MRMKSFVFNFMLVFVVCLFQDSISICQLLCFHLATIMEVQNAASVEFRKKRKVGLRNAESPTRVNNQELIAVTLCKTTFATERMDMLNLGCSSRRILALLESKHKDQSTCNPFSTHSMLRPKHVANIVSTLSACLPETVEPYKEHGHPLLPQLQLRTACRWILQAMHRPMKTRANDSLTRLDELRRFQNELLTRLTPEIRRLLAQGEKQAIEIVRTQHRTMRRIHESGILDKMWLPFKNLL